MAGLLAVMLAACSSATSPAPSAEPTAVPTPAPTPTAVATPKLLTPVPTSTAADLSVRVTFDGETCTYVGPNVIPDGTVVRFEYVPDAQVIGSYLMMYGIEPGTTFQDLVDSLANDDGDVSTDVPDWVYQPTVSWTQGAGTLLYTIESVKHGSDGVDYMVGGYQIMCATPADFPAVQLSVAGA